MSKYLTFLIPPVAIVLFYLGQLIIDSEGPMANIAEKEKVLYKHFEQTFQQIQFKDLKGKTHSYKKGMPSLVVLNFWASWCVPCLEEFPSLIKLRKMFPDDQLLILTVNADEEDKMKSIKKTVKKYNLNVPIIPDKEGKLLGDFSITGIPITIFFHRGKVVEVSKGRKDFISVENIQKYKSWML